MWGTDDTAFRCWGSTAGAPEAHVRPASVCGFGRRGYRTPRATEGPPAARVAQLSELWRKGQVQEPWTESGWADPRTTVRPPCGANPPRSSRRCTCHPHQPQRSAHHPRHRCGWVQCHGGGGGGRGPGPPYLRILCDVVVEGGRGLTAVCSSGGGAVPRDSKPRPTRGGGEDFIRGQFRRDNFVFQFGVEMFPAPCFRTIWGTSCSFCVLSGGGGQVLWRCCWQSVHRLYKWLLVFNSDDLVLFKFWACQSFTPPLVHKEPNVGGVEVSHV